MSDFSDAVRWAGDDLVVVKAKWLYLSDRKKSLPAQLLQYKMLKPLANFYFIIQNTFSMSDEFTPRVRRGVENIRLRRQVK